MSAGIQPNPSPKTAHIDIKVPPYVAIYLAKEYGEAPYEMTRIGSFKEMQTSLMYMSVLPMELLPPPIITPESLIDLRIMLTEPAAQSEIVQRSLERIGTYYSFFYFEFWQCCIAFIRGQQALNGTSRRDAFKNFLTWYEIPEDILSFDSGLRTIQRFVDKRAYRKPKDCPNFSRDGYPDCFHEL